MAEKSIAQKLLIKPASGVWVSPDDGLARLGPLPADVSVVATPAEAGIAVLFVADEGSLRTSLASHGSELGRVPVFWVVYPKGRNDPSEVDVKVARFSETHTARRFEAAVLALLADGDT